MVRDRKVIWYEGMALDPHHFQQWDRYHHTLLNSRLRSVCHFDWGFTKVAIDREGLTNGLFNVLACRGASPDGLVFDCPDADSLEARSLQGFFPATEERLNVFVGVPVERRGCRNCLLRDSEKSPVTRYVAEEISVIDENTGVDERRIEVARPNLQLLFGSEPAEGFSTLKLAEVLRTSEGGYVLDEDYVPPCLAISASEKLMAITGTLLELLVARSAELLDRRHRSAGGPMASSSPGLQVLLLLQVVNTYVPLLNQHHTTGLCHPKDLYSDLLALAGQLSALSPETSMLPRDFPIYDHGDLSSCVRPLEDLIRKCLGESIPTNVVSIPLERQRDSLFVGRVNEDTLFKEARFYLVVRGDLPGGRSIDELPKKARIASPERIDEVLSSFVPALPIRRSERPPGGLPFRPGVHYFQIEKRGPYWEEICRSHALAIFFPTEFSGLELELAAIREG